MRKRLKASLHNDFNTQIEFNGKKLNSCFKIKDTVNFEHKHDLVCHGKSAVNICKDDYVGETGRQFSKRIMDYNGRDVNSHLLKRHMGKEHQCVQNNTVTIKISEALWIKDSRQTLNRYEKSIELSLFEKCFTVEFFVI